MLIHPPSREEYTDSEVSESESSSSEQDEEDLEAIPEDDGKAYEDMNDNEKLIYDMKRGVEAENGGPRVEEKGIVKRATVAEAANVDSDLREQEAMLADLVGENPAPVVEDGGVDEDASATQEQQEGESRPTTRSNKKTRVIRIKVRKMLESARRAMEEASRTTTPAPVSMNNWRPVSTVAWKPPAREPNWPNIVDENYQQVQIPQNMKLHPRTHRFEYLAELDDITGVTEDNCVLVTQGRDFVNSGVVARLRPNTVVGFFERLIARRQIRQIAVFRSSRVSKSHMMSPGNLRPDRRIARANRTCLGRKRDR